MLLALDNSDARFNGLENVILTMMNWSVLHWGTRLRDFGSENSPHGTIELFVIFDGFLNHSVGALLSVLESDAKRENPDTGNLRLAEQLILCFGKFLFGDYPLVM